MPHYKLTYFNLRGRAEIIRYLFTYSDIQYEDHRIEQVDWPKIKPTIPFGKIPVLEVDGVTIHQSLAIARYLAKETGLAGQTLLEQALVDAIVDTIDDFMSTFPWGEKNQDVKVVTVHSKVEKIRFDNPLYLHVLFLQQQAFDDLLTNTAPGLLRDLNSFLGDNKWLVGNSVTWADFYWDVCSTTLLFLKPGLINNHPKLLALKERVQALPAITAWIKQRPETTL